MIQIALMGKIPVVVEEGIRKSIPQKLYLIHTRNESDHQFENEAKKLKVKIEKLHKISTILVKVDAFDLDQIMHTILNIISKEKKNSEFIQGYDFAINLTGGTRPMVVAAATAAYLAGTKVYYVLDSKKTRDADLVKELPIPPRPEDSNLGNTTKTMALVLNTINALGKSTNGILLDRLNQDKKLKKRMTAQKLGYHLTKLEKFGMITVNRGWDTRKIDERTGKTKIDNKLNTITITTQGKYYAEFPDLVGSLK